MKIIRVWQFVNVLRFINYVTSLSDCEDFDGNFHDIHHQNGIKEEKS